MKSKLRNATYITLTGLASIISSQSLKGQDIDWSCSTPLPRDSINLFISPDDTPQANRYNAISDPNAQVDTMTNRINKDFVKMIPYNASKGGGCAFFQLLTEINASAWMKGAYLNNNPLCDGFDGLYDNEGNLRLEEIYSHGGTIAKIGELGLPLGNAGISPDATLPTGHGMIFAIKGNKFTLENIVLIEPQNGHVGVKAGEDNVHENVDEVSLYVRYPYYSSKHNKNIGNIKIASYKIKNGVPMDLKFNPYIKIVMYRDSLQTPVPENIANRASTVFPTEFYDQITIDNSSLLKQVIRMYNMLGQEVLETTKTDQKYTLHDAALKALQPGPYLITVGEGKNREIYKVIKGK